MNRKTHISQLRTKRGIGQRAAADLMSMTQSAVSKLERDDNPQLATLRTFVRRVLGGELHIEVELPSDSTDHGGTRYPLAFGEEGMFWAGPVERYSDRDEFYRAHPTLADGWGWRPGGRSRGTAPFGSDEIYDVRSDDHPGTDRWVITIVAPEARLGPFWDHRKEPVIGAVTATHETSAEILVLAVDIDVRSVGKALRNLQKPSLEEVGATVERVAGV